MKTLNELSKPREIDRGPLLEADVQEKCVEWARKRGYWARKFSSISQRSVPDYIFSKPGIKFFTEFKREGAKRDPLTGLMSTQAQQDEQFLMKRAGWLGFECDNFEHFQLEVQEYEARARSV